MSDWIGRSRSATEAVTPRIVAQFRAALGDMVVPGEGPPGLHWALMPDLAGPEELGPDGHPQLGLFLPDLGLPRRMWAGGEVSFARPVAGGDVVTLASTIADIRHKAGSTGALAFVTVNHVLTVDGDVRITERQDIVYRDPPSGPSADPAPGPDWPDAVSVAVVPDTVMLMRYSALTFNSHRIHYDLPYATGVEGYPGLVVHGPLQAIWLMNHAARQGRLARFSYRGTCALTLGHAVRVESRAAEKGCELRVRRADGVVTMQARAVFG
jgi:3-methylfumaryl-CoA hydratase